MQGQILLIEYRAYGDAIIKNAVINSLGERYPQMKIDVFTKSQFVDIFSINPFVRRIYTATFPLGLSEKHTIGAFKKFIEQLVLLRRRRYDYCLNTVGDIRENLIGKFINPRVNISVCRSKNHVFNRLIVPGAAWSVDKFIEIPDDLINIYSTYDYIVRSLGCKSFLKNQQKKQTITSVGIHPLASKEVKLWSVDKWKRLIVELRKRSIRVEVYCAETERSIVEPYFKELLKTGEVEIKAGSLTGFFSNLKEIDVLIGLDSFSVHAAYAMNVPSVMIVGENNWEIWVPPNSVVATKSNLCSMHPCYNRPQCTGKDFQYQCIRLIEVEDILEKIVQ